ncbi:MAG: MFS transporter [Thermoprotei archaeon]
MNAIGRLYQSEKRMRTSFLHKQASPSNPGAKDSEKKIVHSPGGMDEPQHAHDGRAESSYRVVRYSRIFRSIAISFSTLALPLYMSQLGYSAVIIGLSFFAMAVITVVLLLFYGFIGDRKGYRTSLLIAESLFAVSMIVIALFSNFYIILAAAALGGFGGQGGGGLRGGFSPGLTALVGKLFADSESRIKRIGELTAVGGIASVAGQGLLALHSTLQAHVGAVEAFRILYFAAFFFSVASLLMLLKVWEPAATKKKGLLRRQSTRFVSKVSVANFVNGLGIGMAIPLLPLWFKIHFGLDPTQISVVYICSSIAGVAASLNAHRFSKAANRIKVGSLTRVLNGALLVSMAFPGTALAASALYVARSFGAGVGAPTRSAITLSGVSSDEFGAATSITGVANRLAFGSSSIGGYLLTLMQDLPLEVGGVIQCVAGFLYYYLLRGTP